jgi:outer membrane protein TolC
MKTQSRRSVLPHVEAFASIETNTEDFDSNPSNHTIGVRSQFPIGDPAYFSRRSQADSYSRLAQSQQESIEDRIRTDVVTALKTYQAATTSLPLMSAAVEQAQTSLKLFRPLYKEGRQSILDVLRAEDGLAQTQAAWLQTQAQVHLGYARLQWAIGQFGSSTVKTIASKLEVRR